MVEITRQLVGVVSSSSLVSLRADSVTDAEIRLVG